MEQHEWIRSILLLSLLFQVVPSAAQSRQKYPVILVPGDGGAQAYVEDLSKTQAKPELIWLNLWDFIYTEVVTEKFSLVFDSKSNKTRDKDGYKITFPGWGETWSVEYLDPHEKRFGAYFSKLAETLRKDSYYISNVSLRGSPFDFRKSLNENSDFEKNFIKLVEETYAINNGTPVIIVAHSYGTLYMLKLFSKQSTVWKKKYIKTYVSVSGPYGGSVKAVKTEVCGENFGVFFRSPLAFRKFMQSLTSISFMLPDARLWSRDEPFIITPDTNYTAHDYERLFRDINMEFGYQMMDAVKRSFDPLVILTGIEDVYCIYGSGLETHEQLIYAPPSFFHKAFPDQIPSYINGDGDGTVNLRSLELCKRWPGVKQITLHGAEHVKILHDFRFIRIISEISGAQIPEDVV